MTHAPPFPMELTIEEKTEMLNYFKKCSFRDLLLLQKVIENMIEYETVKPVYKTEKGKI